jgi:2-(1,2-epoxy-1,2-dihydrophenyl)acetyl-CoA isomerase
MLRVGGFGTAVLLPSLMGESPGVPRVAQTARATAFRAVEMRDADLAGAAGISRRRAPIGSRGPLVRGEFRCRQIHIVGGCRTVGPPVGPYGTPALSYESFTLTIDGGVARVRLAQPDRGNPFDLRFCTELSRIATVCDLDPDIRCVLIDADGRFFSVGGDLRSLGRDRETLRTFIKDATVGLHSAVARFARMDAPVVVAVHAMAAGGAVSLAAAADFCLAARSARFYAAYQGIGLAIDGGGSHFLPRRVGSRRATAFYLRNQTWTAEEAVAHGLASDVFDDDVLADEAWSLATELAAGPTRTYGEVKGLLASSWDQPLDAQLELEARAMARTAQTEDTWNAITAVAANKKPTFVGA